MRIYVVAGERSGDLHGAGLMRELRQREDGLAITGLGGSGMHELAAGVRDWAEEAGVVGLSTNTSFSRHKPNPYMHEYINYINKF